MTIELCPACARRPQNPRLGLCDPCREEQVRTRYVGAEHDAATARRELWRERQRRHRARARLRPVEVLPPDTDPLAVVTDILGLLDPLGSLCRTPGQLAALDQATELVKALGWGPEWDAIASAR